MPFKYENMQARILANSVPNSAHVYKGISCRDWTGSVFPAPWVGATRENCYGRIAVRFKRGPRRGKVKSTQAHRESRKAFAPGVRIGSKNVVMHLCDRPICVEPSHLFGGTPKKNVRDAVQKGRHKTPFRRSKKERYTAERAT
jgi:hypothetical protein